MSETAFSRPDGLFDQFGLRSSLLRAVEAAGFTEPRPIQVACIPSVLAGRDVLGLAQTGTGKTAAFVLPMLERLLADRQPGPRALILAPTRELAMQIHAEVEMLARSTPIKAITVFGGVAAGPQIRGLRERPDIVIACPGRLLDLMQQRVAKLDAVEMLVLDEADHMFDLGFLPNVRRILAALPARRQNLLFSATMPSEIRKLADTILKRPHVVELSHSQPASTIEHALYPVSQDRKIDLLHHVLKEDKLTSAIIFSRTKHRAKKLADHLSRAGHTAVALQGNMTQAQRDRAMQGFRAGRFAILVATDIAARGIDVAHVSHVINFDMPSTPDAYTHRIGRTGRAERSGKAYTFVAREDHGAVRALERKLGGPIKRNDVPGLTGMLSVASHASDEGSRSLSRANTVARPAVSEGEKPTRGGTHAWQAQGRSERDRSARRRPRYAGARRAPRGE
jgi:ATP-dependent RNA helicase RhlE